MEAGPKHEDGEHDHDHSHDYEQEAEEKLAQGKKPELRRRRVFSYHAHEYEREAGTKLALRKKIELRRSLWEDCKWKPSVRPAWEHEEIESYPLFATELPDDGFKTLRHVVADGETAV